MGDNFQKYIITLAVAVIMIISSFLLINQDSTMDEPGRPSETNGTEIREEYLRNPVRDSMYVLDGNIQSISRDDDYIYFRVEVLLPQNYNNYPDHAPQYANFVLEMEEETDAIQGGPPGTDEVSISIDEFEEGDTVIVAFSEENAPYEIAEGRETFKVSQIKRYIDEGEEEQQEQQDEEEQQDEDEE